MIKNMTAVTELGFLNYSIAWCRKCKSFKVRSNFCKNSRKLWRRCFWDKEKTFFGCGDFFPILNQLPIPKERFFGNYFFQGKIFLDNRSNDKWFGWSLKVNRYHFGRKNRKTCYPKSLSYGHYVLPNMAPHCQLTMRTFSDSLCWQSGCGKTSIDLAVQWGRPGVESSLLGFSAACFWPPRPFPALRVSVWGPASGGWPSAATG